MYVGALIINSHTKKKIIMGKIVNILLIFLKNRKIQRKGETNYTDLYVQNNICLTKNFGSYFKYLKIITEYRFLDNSI